MVQTILLTFVAGVFGANGTPHFVKGITKEQFPTVFGAGPLVNLVAGWTMYVLTAVLLIFAHLDRHPMAALVSGALGVLLMGAFHARLGAFGKRPAPSH